MTAAGAGSFPSPDQLPLLAEVLAPGLAAAFGNAAVITEARTATFDGSSSFAAGRMEVVLASGAVVPVFVKDLDPANQLAEAKAVRTEGMERSRREVRVYRDLLAGAALGTPTLYGVHWDEVEGRYWLLLEDAGPKRLSRLGDFSLWVAAAAWLGRFHAVVGAGEGLELPAVTREELATRARRSADLVERLEGDTRRAVELGVAAVDDLLDVTFADGVGVVHGEFFGKNVVIRPAPTAAAVAVIDWETAALAPQHLDLVSICAGRWTTAQRRSMRLAYHRARAPLDAGLTAWEDFDRAVDAAAAVNALAWLGWWSEGDDAHIRRWSEEVRVTVSQVTDGTRGGGR